MSWTKIHDDTAVALGNENVRAYNNFKKSYKGMLAGMNPSEAQIQARAGASKAGISPIVLTAGMPDQTLLPFSDLMEFAKLAWERSYPAPLQYGASALLKQEIAKYMTRTRGAKVEPAEICVTGGNGPGLQVVMSSYLGPGDIAIVESPLWTFTANLMAQYGATVISVGMDKEGILVDEVERQILSAESSGKRIKMIYVQPINHNPTGIAMSHSRAEKLLQLASSHKAVIVSDEPYEMYCYNYKPCFLSQMSGGKGVLTVHTFSKTLGTGLRLGYVHSQPEYLVPLETMSLIPASVFWEYSVGELMASGRYEQIITKANGIYASKLKTFCDALDTHVGHQLAVPPERNGGFFVWIELKTLPADEVHLEMLARGVESRLGKNMHGPGHLETSSAGAQKTCHLGFSFINPSEEELVEAAKRIAAACAAVESKQPAAKL